MGKKKRNRERFSPSDSEEPAVARSTPTKRAVRKDSHSEGGSTRSRSRSVSGARIVLSRTSQGEGTSAGAKPGTKRRKIGSTSGSDGCESVEMNEVDDRSVPVQSECENGVVCAKGGSTIDRMNMTKNGLTEYLLNEKNVSKTVCENVLKAMNEYERIMSKLMCENAELKGRVSECVRLSECFRVNGAGNVCGAQVQTGKAGTRVNGGMAGVNVVNPPKPSYAVILKGVNENFGVDAVKEGVMNEVKRNTKLRVLNIRSTRAGGIAVAATSSLGRDLLANSAGLKELGVTAEVPRRPGPRVIVFGVPNSMTQDRFMRELYERNVSDVCSVNDFKKSVRMVTRMSKKGADDGNVVIEVSANVRERLLNERRMYLEWRALRVNDYERIFRCFGCYGFGHRLSECKVGRVCFRCGRDGHRGADCVATEDCRNCRLRGSPSAHSVLSPECPEHVWRLNALRARMHDG